MAHREDERDAQGASDNEEDDDDGVGEGGSVPVEHDLLSPRNDSSVEDDGNGDGDDPSDEDDQPPPPCEKTNSLPFYRLCNRLEDLWSIKRQRNVSKTEEELASTPIAQEVGGTVALSTLSNHHAGLRYQSESLHERKTDRTGVL